MDLTLSTDQQSLQTALRESLQKLWTPDRLRKAADTAAFDDVGWSALADMGVFGVTVAESEGGMGLGFSDATVLFEELGKALAQGPLVPSLLAAHAVPGVLDGTSVVTSVDSRDQSGIVEHFGVATHLVVVDDDGLYLLQTRDCESEPMTRPLDPLTPVAAVKIPAERGERIGTPADAQRWRAAGTVLTAALQVGVAQGGLDLAVRYAKERVQFDRVIGSFQAVKHLLAESLVRVDLARAAVLVAGLEFDGAGSEISGAQVAISTAKALADKAATEGGRCCVQVHGGMGFTWEVLAHLYLKRAWLQATSYGSADEHTLRLADAISAPSV